MKLCTKSGTEPRYNLGSKVKKNPRHPRFNVMNEEKTEDPISLHEESSSKFCLNTFQTVLFISTRLWVK